MQRDEAFELSRHKSYYPYQVDREHTFYCPQENLEALIEDKRINNHHEHMLKEYIPSVSGSKVIMLLLPCVKKKPYNLSAEHLAINRYLLRSGFRPTADAEYPSELEQIVEPDEKLLLNNSVLKRGDIYLHRVVISEPMALVPYEYIYYYNKKLSMFSQYDDPGLFEHRGTSVCPWRSDYSARPVGKKFGWGPQEKLAYVKAHNLLAERIAGMLKRLHNHYGKIIGYVAPKLTHRSFLTDVAQKRMMGLPISRLTAEGKLNLLGVGDILPDLVKIIPDNSDIEQILLKLKKRLVVNDDRYVKSYFATGGGVATALVLPESLEILDSYLN